MANKLNAFTISQDYTLEDMERDLTSIEEWDIEDCNEVIKDYKTQYPSEDWTAENWKDFINNYQW